MSVSLSVAAIGGHGPKSTAVNFVKVDGVRPWAWIPNEVAAALVPGMVVRVDHVAEGKVETTYTSNGQVFDLKVPKVQLFLGGTIQIDSPNEEQLPAPTYIVTDAAAKYREAYLAKQVTATVNTDDILEGF